MKDDNPLLRAALDYAAANWYVFPVEPRGKKPLTTNGFKAATTDRATINGWWTKTPTANIGLDCGKSGLVVVDLDQRGDRDGFAEWDELVTRQHVQAKTYTSLTGGGGKHLLFKAPAGIEIKNSAGKLAPGIDVRGAGGYIVLPPSIHPSGRAYEWADPEAMIEPLPEPLIDALLAEPDPWKIFTLRDAAQPRPPLTWLVDDRILPMNSLSIWYGAPGTLKSMVLADLAVCVAGGKRWLMRQDKSGGHTTPGGPVLWLDFDNGQRRTHERFAAMAAAHGIPSTAPLHYVSMPEPGLDVGDTASAAALASRIVTLNAHLVVIDNLGVICGSADENSAEMQKPMGGLRWLVEATGAAIVVLHHQRKTPATAETRAASRAGDSLRGHGSIEAKLDYAVLVTRDDDNVFLKATKVRGPSFKELSALFTYDNDDSDELLSARFFGTSTASVEELNAIRFREDICDVLRKTPYQNANEIVGRLKGNRKAILDCLRILKTESVIGERPGPNLSRQLYLIDASA